MEGDGFKASRLVVAALLAFVVSVVVVALALPRSEIFAERERPQVRERPMPPGPARQEPPRPGPGEVEALPPVTTPYTATIVHLTHTGVEERREIVHGRRWRREERVQDGNTIVAFEDLRSPLTIGWTRDANGADVGIAASVEVRAPDQRSFADMFYKNTGATAVALGERCTIWEGDYARQDVRTRRSRFTTCITDDGIRLWTRGRDFEGNERVNGRLLNLQRREVSAEASNPPAHLFRWSVWQGAVEQSPAHNLSIDYGASREDVRNGEDDRETIRERGDWRYTHTADAPSEIWVISSSGLYFSYAESNFGSERRHMSVSRTPRRAEPNMRGQLLQPARTETIVSQRCRWFEMLAHSHASASACITDDGLTLARLFQGDGVMGHGYFNVRATRLSRDPLPASAMAPPPRAFEWLD